MVPVRRNNLVRICLITTRCAAAGWFRGSGSRTGTECTPVLWVGGNEPIHQSPITPGVIRAAGFTTGWFGGSDSRTATEETSEAWQQPYSSAPHVRARNGDKPGDRQVYLCPSSLQQRSQSFRALQHRCSWHLAPQS